jgi:clan AA aspartic protease (TIGR02281 family)
VAQNSTQRCPQCLSPLPALGAICAACGHRTQAAQRTWPVWLAGVLGLVGGAGVTLFVVARLQQRPASGPAAASAPPAVVPELHVAPPDSERHQPVHTATVYGRAGTKLGSALILAVGRPLPEGLFPLARLPLRDSLGRNDGNPMPIEVSAVAVAYGFVLLRGLDCADAVAVPPRREPIANGTALRAAGTELRSVVLSRAPSNPNELVLDRELPDGVALLDDEGKAAALSLGSTRALAVTPVWSWLAADAPAVPLAQAQAELRARDPASLLEDATRAAFTATTPEATRVAIDQLELGFGLARADMVAEYDRALRAAHRVLARRLADAGRQQQAFAHVRACTQRFLGDVDWLADAVVLAAGAGEVMAASEYWLELRSRDGARAHELTTGLVAAFMDAAQARVAHAPREASELLARGVELFADHAAMRMSYAGALLASGEGDNALWQARVAAARDPALAARLHAIEARTVSATSALEIPIDPQSHILRAQCSVAGHSLELVVDTGASITVLPLALAGAGSPTGRRVRIQTASGEVEADLVRFPELKIGPVTMRHILAATMDLPGTLAGRGLLGMNVLRRLNLELDTHRGVLVLRK